MPARRRAATKTNPSVMNCRMSRPGPAPNAPRTAISRLRLSERTSSRLATLTQAMISNRSAPPSRSRRIGRMSPSMLSLKRQHGSTLTVVGIGILRRQLLRYRVEVRLRGRNRDAIFQPRDADQVVTAPPLFAAADWLQRRPEVSAAPQRVVRSPSAARRRRCKKRR